MSTDNLDVEPSQLSDIEVLYKFSIYPFSEDPVFQEGLQSIVSSAQGKSSEELENLIGQAKVFYFARTTGHQVTWESYLEWKRSHVSSLPGTPTDRPGGKESTDMSAPTPIEGQENLTPLTFHQITELIKTGQTHLIPNNKVIPETLHNDVPSESTMSARKKPWETVD